MTSVAAILAVALPFASALVLALVPSWRFGVRFNASSATLQFLVAGALVWQADTPASRLVALTAFVAMATSWSGRQEITAALATRLLSRQRARRYHAGYQLLVGAIQAATLADELMLTWLALVVAVAAAAIITGAARSDGAATAASRLIRDCSIGLSLALLGTVLLDVMPNSAAIFLLLGYGALAGLVPLHAWWVCAVEEGIPSGAIVVTLMANVPIKVFASLHGMPAADLITFALVSLIPAAAALFAPLDWRRRAALATTAQLGMVVFAIGVGANGAAWLLLALLSLARAVVLQSHGEDVFAWLGLALLPLYALHLLAGPTVALQAWLLAPLAAGALLTSCALLAHRPTAAPANWRTSMPIWLQLSVMILLAFALPTRTVPG